MPFVNFELVAKVSVNVILPAIGRSDADEPMGIRLTIAVTLAEEHGSTISLTVGPRFGTLRLCSVATGSSTR